jgi:hypothetical protein
MPDVRRLMGDATSTNAPFGALDFTRDITGHAGYELSRDAVIEVRYVGARGTNHSMQTEFKQRGPWGLNLTVAYTLSRLRDNQQGGLNASRARRQIDWIWDSTLWRVAARCLAHAHGDASVRERPCAERVRGGRLTGACRRRRSARS